MTPRRRYSFLGEMRVGTLLKSFDSVDPPVSDSVCSRRLAFLSVAPRAGAWIETQRGAMLGRHSEVAPRAGAWIETTLTYGEQGSLMSRPVRARGLKPGYSRDASGRSRQVAPRAGAWIETTMSSPVSPGGRTSRPVRARGLKHQIRVRHVAVTRSRPVRARGLKPLPSWMVVSLHWSRPVRARGLKHAQDRRVPHQGEVAPRAGAWIETRLRIH